VKAEGLVIPPLPAADRVVISSRARCCRPQRLGEVPVAGPAETVEVGWGSSRFCVNVLPGGA
jgi:hypothetical protein